MTDYTRVVTIYQDRLINEKSFMYASPCHSLTCALPDYCGVTRLMWQKAYLTRLKATESTAKRYFANENPVGKVLKVGTDTTLYQVTGVIQDCPSNSQIKYDFLASWSSLNKLDEEKSYWDANYTTYLLFKELKSIYWNASGQDHAHL